MKGWMDADGETHEKVYDVAWSGERKPGPSGKVSAVGNTVDVKNATWTNTIGSPELIAVWTDLEFDRQQTTLNIQPVIPFKLGENANLITRNSTYPLPRSCGRKRQEIEALIP